MIGQCLGNVVHTVRKVHLSQVTGIGPKQGNLTPVQTGADQQSVKGIALRFTEPYPLKGIFELDLDLVQDDIVGQGVDERKFLHPIYFPIASAHTIRALCHNPQTEVLENREHVGQRETAAGVVEAQAQHLTALLYQPVQGHTKLLTFLQTQDLLDIQYGYPGVKIVAVARGKTGSQLTDIYFATLLSKLLGQPNPQAVFPVQGCLDNLVF